MNATTRKRFLKAQFGETCDCCDKVRSTCRFCEKCYEHCDCPICSKCGRADMTCCDEFIAEVSNGCTDPCRCEYCATCGKLTDGDELCLHPTKDNGKRYCERCAEKL